MRRLLVLACALALLAPVTADAHAAARRDTGGTSAPSAGGLSYKQPVRAVSRFTAPPFRPVARSFRVAPGTLVAGRPATFAFRIDAVVPKVRVRVALTRRTGARRVVLLRLGYRTTGRRHSHTWTPSAGALPAGEYDVALQAFDDTGQTLRRTAKASGRARLSVTVPPPPPEPEPPAVAPTPSAPVGSGMFPIRGPYSFGGADARFGAIRTGHVHQGQDITAAEGTPVASPVAGTVYWVAYQAGGAGHYVVIRDARGRDHVFMHLRDNSVLVAKGAAVASGQVFAQVGSTGSSSGPHLHFELWPHGWYASGGSSPVDPRPQLEAWAAR